MRPSRAAAFSSSLVSPTNSQLVQTARHLASSTSGIPAARFDLANGFPAAVAFIVLGSALLGSRRIRLTALLFTVTGFARRLDRFMLDALDVERASLAVMAPRVAERRAEG